MGYLHFESDVCNVSIPSRFDRASILIRNCYLDFMLSSCLQALWEVGRCDSKTVGWSRDLKMKPRFEHMGRWSRQRFLLLILRTNIPRISCRRSLPRAKTKNPVQHRIAATYRYTRSYCHGSILTLNLFLSHEIRRAECPQSKQWRKPKMQHASCSWSVIPIC